MRFFFRRLLPAAKTAIRLRGRLLAISRKCDSSSRLVQAAKTAIRRAVVYRRFRANTTPRAAFYLLQRPQYACAVVYRRFRANAIPRPAFCLLQKPQYACAVVYWRFRANAIPRPALCLRQYDGSLSSIDKKTQPEGLRLTNPPKWGLLRCNILRQAIERRRSLDPLDARRFFRTYRFTRRSRWAIQIAARLVCAF